MRKALKITLLVVVPLNILILLSGKTYLYNAVLYNFANIHDYEIFPSRTIEAGSPEPWPVASAYNNKKLPPESLSAIERYESVAFLVAKNDSLLYEKYWDGYGPSSYSSSFSMAKTYVSVLTGIAISEGKIRSVDQPVADFIPSFREGDKAKVTIKHLLTMSSGLDWDESYINPLSVTTEAYYGSNLMKLVNNMQVIEEPGRDFKYLSGNTLVLGAVLTEATGTSLSEYMSRKLWKITGSGQDATWSTDREGGLEKAYCCINSNVRDFARIGKLYMNGGRWNGQQVVDEQYVLQSIQPAELQDGNKPLDRYGYSWWLMNYRDHDIFYARGILGQYVICIPDKDLIIARLGHKRSLEHINGHPEDVFMYIDAALAVADAQ